MPTFAQTSEKYYQIYTLIEDADAFGPRTLENVTRIEDAFHPGSACARNYKVETQRQLLKIHNDRREHVQKILQTSSTIATFQL